MNDDGKRDLWRTAEVACDLGWRTEMSRDGHLVLHAPDDTRLALAGVASSHPRTVGNLAALLRRYGASAG